MGNQSKYLYETQSLTLNMNEDEQGESKGRPKDILCLHDLVSGVAMAQRRTIQPAISCPDLSTH